MGKYEIVLTAASAVLRTSVSSTVLAYQPQSTYQPSLDKYETALPAAGVVRTSVSGRVLTYQPQYG